MNHVEPTVEYKVWYKLNPAYKGSFQVEKMGKPFINSRGEQEYPIGLHGTFGPSAGGFERAQQEVAKCKAWFNEEKKAIEREGPGGKAVVEVRTTIHDNVIVWIEKYIDGFRTTGQENQCDEQKPAANDEVEKLRAELAELREKTAAAKEPAKESPKKGKKERELEEATA